MTLALFLKLNLINYCSHLITCKKVIIFVNLNSATFNSIARMLIEWGERKVFVKYVSRINKANFEKLIMLSVKILIFSSVLL